MKGDKGSNMARIVTGYHGCHADAARQILSGSSLLPSQNGYDWLGMGIYFWEDGPSRAEEWARKRFGGAGAVLRATIDLGHCLNLLDTAHFDRIARTYQEVVRSSEQLDMALPRNSRKRHDLDCLVIDSYCEQIIARGGEAIQTVRGCFPEGEPLYEGSKILRETHIQIAVRVASCIHNLAVVH
jgi:hypothetical protein